MPARLHEGLCRAMAKGWGRGWADACTCDPGRFEEQQRVTAAGQPGQIASIFRTRAGRIRFTVEADDGRLAVFTADQLAAVETEGRAAE